ncbi:MAG TPA: radical SAM protein [Nostocaceae cyanobacterium]|nr:radical SAM protein [Nostocaceae cyanobacterium]
MKVTYSHAPTIGLVEVPALGLYDPEGHNWTALYRRNTLLSKQVLMADLQAGGFDARLVNLKNGDRRESFGEVIWKGMNLTKTYVGSRIYDIDPEAYDAWGVTVNYTQERQVTCMVISHLASKGKPVVVGGSDAIAEPRHYLEAGAAAIVIDKSGAANWPVFDYVLGKTPREKLTGVILADGTYHPTRTKAMSPDEWALPSVEVARQCLGQEYSEEPFIEELVPIGSVYPDIGCDRKCDFCQTPTYTSGYRRMSPQTTLNWIARQKEAGAKCTVMGSDQFLGRVLFPGGREEVLEITKGAREMGMPLLWPNGLELRKATLGRGRNYENTDLTPDEELIEALWGWDGKVGGFLGYIPAERPVFGRESYSKLLPWQQHCEMMRAIVRVGLPVIVYGLIIGLPDDNHDSLLHLEEAVLELHQQLREINPELEFQVASYAISPIPGTPQGENIRKSGLLRFDDPSIVGGLWTPSCDTNHLSYADISDWQFRLTRIGKAESKLINYHGGLTKLAASAY